MSWVTRLFVVYFNQQIGALHAIRWSKSLFSTLNPVFPFLKEKKRMKIKKITTKFMTIKWFSCSSARPSVLWFGF